MASFNFLLLGSFSMLDQVLRIVGSPLAEVQEMESGEVEQKQVRWSALGTMRVSPPEKKINFKFGKD
jgi:hypothetical protein